MNGTDSEWFAHQSRRRRYLVGVSGGADSMALLHLLLEHGFRNLVVCHLDHRLRGRASTADARFVARAAGSLGLPAELGRIDLRQSAEDSGESVETAARRARQLRPVLAERPRELVGKIVQAQDVQDDLVDSLHVLGVGAA